MSSTQQAATTLDQLSPGQRAVVTAVHGTGALRQHILDMGVVPGVTVTFSKAAPLGDPLEYIVRDYKLTLRKEDAARVDVRPVERKPAPRDRDGEVTDRAVVEIEHPGLGEGGRYHVRQ